MNVKRERIRLSVYPPSQSGPLAENGDKPTTNSKGSTAADQAVLRLARLLGRQIAREQFEHTRSKNRHASGQ